MASPSQVSAPPPFVRLATHPLRWRLMTELAHTDLRVRELVTLTGEPQNLISYHLRLLRDGGLVAARRSNFDARDSYYHLDLDRCAQALSATGAALHPALGPATATPTPAARPRHTPQVRVLFACTGNSARSPIAEALLRHHTAGRFTVTSAGSHPKPRLHPHAVRVLRERYGIDITGQHPRRFDTLTDRGFDYVVSLCDKVREVCPEFPHHPRRIHWSIPDPATATGDTGPDGYPAFRRTATEIDTRIRYLIPTITTSFAEVYP